MNQKTEIQSAQLYQILSTSKVTLISSMFLAVILAFIQRGVIDHTVIYIWLSLTIIITLSRIALVFVCQDTPADDATAHVWLARFRLGVLISGLVWGGAGFLLFPANHPQHQLFLIFILAGLSVGSVISYSADLGSGIIFPVSALIPITIRFFIEGDQLYVAMGVAMMLYLGFMIVSSRQINRNVCENIILRIEATEREKTIKESEQRWKTALEGAGDGLWDYNFQTNINTVSSGLKKMLGFNVSVTEENIQLNDWLDRLHPDSLVETMKALQAVVDNTTDSYVVEQQIRCEDGGYKWILCRGRALSRSADGKPIRLIGTGIDLTERKQAEQQLRIAAIAFESQEGMFVTDTNCIILRINHAFTRITGYTAEEAIGRTPTLLNSGRQDKHFYASMWDRINNTGVWDGEIWNRRKNDEIYPEHLTITVVKDAHGVVTNYVATFTDITTSKAASDEIENLAFYDPLTQLPNRRLLMDRLKQGLASSARSGQKGAVLFLDLDHFKTLNDTLGHDVGDVLLQQVSDRLRACIREGDTVARLGGDEFVVLLEHLSEQAIEAAMQTETIGDKIMAALNKPFQLGIYEHFNTSSIGATLFNAHESEIETLLKQADIAMYQAKGSGRNTLRFFDPKMQETITARVNLEHELRKAIDQQQFQLHYQIQMDSTGHVLGAETLIRWQHPERGMILPLYFIPLAEATGLILPIGRWVLETACAQLKLWQQDTLTRNLILSVNVSPQQFLKVDFAVQVLDVVQRHAIDPAKLKLEFTESMLVDGIEKIVERMSVLAEIGIHFSLDDFGTGYSSLQYLKKLPLHQLKIDQSFVRDIETDSSDQAIVRTIITMAHSLDLDVIAEGVETEGQRQFLFDNNCTHYQGHLIGKPMPINQFEASLKKEVTTHSKHL